MSTRETVYNIKHREEDPVLNSALAGDLSPGAEGPLYWKDTLARSCFLCNWGMFRHFALEGGWNMDFWYAIGTGVPEIQDYAIGKMKKATSMLGVLHAKEFIDQLYLLEDDGSLLWTPELKVKLRDMVLHFMKALPGMLDLIPEWLYGIAEVDLRDIVHPSGVSAFNHYRRKGKDEGYVIAMVRSILNFKSVNSVSERVDTVLKKYGFETVLNAKSKFDLYMRMGYSVLILFALNNDAIRTDQMITRIIKNALREVDYNMLLYLCNYGYTSGIQPQDEPKVRFKGYIIREKAENARRCLDEPRIVRLMGPALLAIYRTIAGEIFRDTRPWNSYRLPVANPGVSLGGNEYITKSIQGIVMYDPEWLYDLGTGQSMVAATYSAARGNVLAYSKPKAPVTPW